MASSKEPDLSERAVKKFRLTPVYENVAKLNNLKEVFSSDMQTIERIIDNALRHQVKNQIYLCP